MPGVLKAVSRWMPLLLAIFFSISIVQTASQLGVSLAGIDAVLRRGSWLFLAMAAMATVAVIIGLAAEARIGADSGKLTGSGVVPAVLRALTGRRIEKPLPVVDIDAGTLAATLKAAVIGQDGVCDDMALQVRRRLAMVGRDKPVGVFLMAGPPGTGKTLLAKSLAQALGVNLLHLDMAQYNAQFSATTLFGSPRGYIGSDTHGKLVAGLHQSPDALVLLDEVEKAHPDVVKRFLVAWNDGKITEASDGSIVSCSRALFVMTSNAATKPLTEAAEDFSTNPDRLRQESVEILREAGFASEVLDRIDRIFIFNKLGPIEIEQVAELEVERLVRQYGFEVAKGDIDQAIMFDIMSSQVGRGASARDLGRAVEARVSDALIKARANGGTRVRLVQAEAGVVAEVVS